MSALPRGEDSETYAYRISADISDLLEKLDFAKRTIQGLPQAAKADAIRGMYKDMANEIAQSALALKDTGVALTSLMGMVRKAQLEKIKALDPEEYQQWAMWLTRISQQLSTAYNEAYGAQKAYNEASQQTLKDAPKISTALERRRKDLENLTEAYVRVGEARKMAEEGAHAATIESLHGNAVGVGAVYTGLPKDFSVENLTKMEGRLSELVMSIERFVVGADTAAAAVKAMKSPLEAIEFRNIAVLEEALKRVATEQDAVKASMAGLDKTTREGRQENAKYSEQLVRLGQEARTLQTALNKLSVEAAQFAANTNDLAVSPSLLGKTDSNAYANAALSQLAAQQGIDVGRSPFASKVASETERTAAAFGTRVEAAVNEIFTAAGAAVDGISKKVSGQIAGIPFSGTIDRVIDPAIAGIQNAEAEVIIDVKAVNDEVFKYIRAYGDFVMKGGDAVAKLRDMLTGSNRYAAQAAEYILQLNAYSNLAGKSAYVVGTPNLSSMMQQYSDLVKQGATEAEAFQRIAESAARDRQVIPVAVKPGTGVGPAPMSQAQVGEFGAESMQLLREQASATRVLSELDSVRLAKAEQLRDAQRLRIAAAQEEKKRLEEIAATEQQRVNAAPGGGGGSRNPPPVTGSSAALPPEPPSGSSVAEQLKYYEQLLQRRQMELYTAKQIVDVSKQRVQQLKDENATFSQDREANENRIKANNTMIGQYQDIIAAQNAGVTVAKKDIEIAEAKIKLLRQDQEALVSRRELDPVGGSINPADVQATLFEELKRLPALTTDSYGVLKAKLVEIRQELAGIIGDQKGVVAETSNEYDGWATTVAKLAAELKLAQAEAAKLTTYSSANPQNFQAGQGAFAAQSNVLAIQAELSDAREELSVHESLVLAEQERLAAIQQLDSGVQTLTKDYDNQYKQLLADEKELEKAQKERMAVATADARAQASASRTAKKVGAAAAANAELEAYRKGIELRRANIEQLKQEAAATDLDDKARGKLHDKIEAERNALALLQASYQTHLKDAELVAAAARKQADAAELVAKGLEKQAAAAAMTENEGAAANSELIAQEARQQAIALNMAAISAEKDAAALAGLSTAMGVAQKEMGALAKSVGDAEKAKKSWIDRVFTMQRVASTFFGTFLSGLAFQAMSALQTAFQTSTDYAKELEVSLTNVDVAVRASERQFGEAAGSVGSWRDFIASLRTEFRAFNDSELAQGVSQIINYTRDLNLSADAQQRLATSAAQLALATPGKSFADAAEAVARGIAGEQRALRDYMVLISPEMRDAKSLELYGKAYDSLTSKVKQATVNQAVFFEAMSGRAQDAAVMLDNVAVRQQAATNRLKTDTVGVGKAWNELWTGALESASYAIEKLGVGFAWIAGHVEHFGQSVTGVVYGFYELIGLGQMVQNTFKGLYIVLKASGLYDWGIRVGDALRGVTRQLGDVQKQAKGLTSGIAGELLPAVNEAIRKMQDLQDEAAKKRLDAQKKAQKDSIQARVDYLADMAKLILGAPAQRAALASEKNDAFTQLTIKQTQENVDAYNQYQMKEFRDTEDFNIKMVRMQEDFDRNEQDAEKEHQKKLRDIRRSSYFDLLDAIREQDARAVLLALRKRNEALRNAEQENQDAKDKRLEDFEAKKKQAQEDFNLDRKRAKEDFDLSVRDRERKFAQERADLENQYHDKEIQLQQSLDREAMQRRSSYDASLSDIKNTLQDDLNEIQGWYDEEVDKWTQSWVDKYDITREQLDRIMEYMEGKIGPNGDMVKMYEDAIKSILELNPPPTNNMPKTNSKEVIQAARGGSWIVDSPTNFLAGEGGSPEAVQITPLGAMSASGMRSSSAMSLNVNVTADEHFSIAFEDRVISAIADVVETLK